MPTTTNEVRAEKVKAGEVRAGNERPADVRQRTPLRARAGRTRRPDPSGHVQNDVHLHNRIPAVLIHICRYAFEGQARLAADVGVSRSTVSRFLRGHTQPSYALVEAIARALSLRLGKPLDPRELVSFDGTYPTGSTCALVGCRGCLPDRAYDADGDLHPDWKGQKPGDWSRFPEPTEPMQSADLPLT